MKQTTGLYPRIRVDGTGAGLVSQAGAALLVRAVQRVGLDAALRDALGAWRRPTAVHDPGKVVLDLALTLAIGGDCLADVAQLRASPAVFGRVASDATVSRTIVSLGGDADAVLKAIAAARARACARAWRLAGKNAPDHEASPGSPVVIDLDATLVTAHSQKENAAPTFKRGFGFHPLCAFVDHGAEGTGEPLAIRLRAGNAGSNTAADHITVTRDALRQLPSHQAGRRAGKSVLVRTDGAGCTHEYVSWLHKQRVQYSIGFTLPTDFEATLKQIPASAWSQAYDAEGQIREGAFIAEVTDMLDLTSWPDGMRVIIRKEKPHPGAQLRITDVDGNRVTAFATNTTPGGPGRQLADLELRHRRRARAEDRIRCAKDTGLRNLPLKGFDQNRIWTAIVALACELTAWMQTLGLHEHPARRWEPKKLRLRLFSIPARMARTARRATLHAAADTPWTSLLTSTIARLDELGGLARPG